MTDSTGSTTQMRSRTIETPIGPITLAGTLASDGTDVLHHVVMEDQAHAPDPSDWVEEPGAFADLVVLSQDVLAVEPAAIPETRALLTMVGGDVVHSG